MSHLAQDQPVIQGSMSSWGDGVEIFLASFKAPAWRLRTRLRGRAPQLQHRHAAGLGNYRLSTPAHFTPCCLCIGKGLTCSKCARGQNWRVHTHIQWKLFLYLNTLALKKLFLFCTVLHSFDFLTVIMFVHSILWNRWWQFFFFFLMIFGR